MHLEAEMNLNSAMHLEAIINQVRRCTWRPRLCNSEMHMRVVIERVGRWI